MFQAEWLALTGPPYSSGQPAPAGCRVLVVEDEPVLAGVIGRLVVAAGGIPAVVTTATAALELLQSRPFDLLIADLCLPGGAGYALTAEARQRWPGLVIAVSSGVLGSDEDLPPEADVYLHKPLRLEMIRHLVALAPRH